MDDSAGDQFHGDKISKKDLKGISTDAGQSNDWSLNP